jgi:hypothetical protein
LDLIEVSPDPLAAAKLRIAAVVFLEQLIELPRIDTGQAIVVKADKKIARSGATGPRHACWSCLRKQVLPARLIPMTAWALLGIFGRRMSRCVSAC